VEAGTEIRLHAPQQFQPGVVFFVALVNQILGDAFMLLELTRYPRQVILPVAYTAGVDGSDTAQGIIGVTGRVGMLMIFTKGMLFLEKRHELLDFFLHGVRILH